MERLIFVPILKTKKLAEPKVIDKTIDLFSESIIPYLEIKPDANPLLIESMQKKLCSRKHFEGILRKKDDSLDQIINRTRNTISGSFTIPVIHLRGREIISNEFMITEAIKAFSEINDQIGIRIPQIPVNSRFIDYLLSSLNSDSFLFIDIGDDPYSANEYYLESLCQKNRECKIILINSERPDGLTGEDYEDNDYNYVLRTETIDSIKSHSFVCDGFASYCSAKNNMNEGGGAKPVYAVFLIYNFKKNNFFSIRSNEKLAISSAYASLKQKVAEVNQKDQLITPSTPASYCDLNDFINSTQKGVASTYYRIGMIHYIEEIYYNLFGKSEPQ